MQGLQKNLNSFQNTPRFISTVDNNVSNLTQQFARLVLDVSSLKPLPLTAKQTLQEISRLRGEIENIGKKLGAGQIQSSLSTIESATSLIRMVDELCRSFAQVQSSLELLQKTSICSENFQRDVLTRLDQLTIAVEVFIQKRSDKEQSTNFKKRKRQQPLEYTTDTSWNLTILLDEPQKRGTGRTCRDWRLDTSFNWTGTTSSRYLEFNSEDREPWNVFGCSLGSPIGLGATGKVCSFRADGRDLALKVVYKNTPKSLSEYVREALFLAKISHHHIVQIVGAFTSHDYFGILLYPKAEAGSLFDFLNTSERSTRWTRIILSNIGCLAGAVDFLHSEAVSFLHGDIKPQNILVHGTTMILADFGYSIYFGPGRLQGPILIPYTANFTAPEGCPSTRGTEIGTAADIWSLGLVFWNMMDAVTEKTRFKWSFPGWPKGSVELGFREAVGGLVRNGFLNTTLTVRQTQHASRIPTINRANSFSNDELEQVNEQEPGTQQLQVSRTSSFSSTYSWSTDLEYSSPSPTPYQSSDIVSKHDDDSLSVSSTDPEERRLSFSQYYDVEQDNCFDLFLKLMVSRDMYDRPNAELVHFFFKMPEWHGLFCGDCCADKGSRANPVRYRPVLEAVKGMHQSLCSSAEVLK